MILQVGHRDPFFCLMKRIPIYSNWVVCHPLNIQFKTFPNSTFFTASRNGFFCKTPLRTCSTSSPTRTPAFSACDPGLFRSKLRGRCQGWACSPECNFLLPLFFNFRASHSWMLPTIEVVNFLKFHHTSPNQHLQPWKFLGSGIWFPIYLYPSSLPFSRNR